VLTVNLGKSLLRLLSGFAKAGSSAKCEDKSSSDKSPEIEAFTYESTSSHEPNDPRLCGSDEWMDPVSRATVSLRNAAVPLVGPLNGSESDKQDFSNSNRLSSKASCREYDGFDPRRSLCMVRST
jgi:hypothetical protein